MMQRKRQRFVIDTNVVFKGLTQSGGASGLLIDSWLAGLYQVCVSNSVAYEYVDVLSRKIMPSRWERLKPVVGSLLAQANFVVIYYTWRPSSPDPADEHVVDCALNSGSAVVTWNLRDFHLAQQELGLVVLTPVEALSWLAQQQRGGQ